MKPDFSLLRKIFLPNVSLSRFFSQGLDFCCTHAKKIVMVFFVLLGILASLSLSCALFMRFLGYSFGADWSAWHFIQYASESLSSQELRSHWLFSLIAPFGLLSFLVIFGLKKTQSTLFGNAHWATIFEAKKSGLLSTQGVILGKKWGRYLRVDGFEHVFVFAPSGSKKTNSLVTPNLLTWSGSCIVQDIKGTLFEDTSGFRAKYGQACFLWNPGSRDGKTHAYNPIDSVSKNPLLRVDDLQKIANILIPENPNANDPLWTSAPRQLFVALQLYLLDTPDRPKTLGEMTRLVKNTPNFQAWIYRIMNLGFEVKFYHPETVMEGNFYLYADDSGLRYAFVDSQEQIVKGEIHNLAIQQKLAAGEEPYLLDVNTLIQTIIAKGQLLPGSQVLDPLCRRNFFQYLQNDYKLQSSILQSFLSYFELFDNPLVDAATSHSDFDITQFKKMRMTVYVATGSDNLSRLSSLLTVFYQQAMDAMLREIPDLKKEPYGVLLLLDEFSALKRMESFQKNIGLMREYRVRVMAIIQNLPQLYVTYGHDGAAIFIDNKYRVAFAQNNEKAAELVSKWCGFTTVEQQSHNAQTGSGGFFRGSQTTSVTKIPLINTDGVMQLNPKKMIIAIEGAAPILANKNPWFDDPELKKRKINPIKLPTLQAKIVPFDQSEVRQYFKEKEIKEKQQAQKEPNELSTQDEEIY
jgi:type IV secretion system protein VirD4